MPTLDSLAHLDGYGLLVARCLLSLVFAASAYDKFRAPPEELAMLGRLHLPFPELVERGIGAFEVLGAISLISVQIPAHRGQSFRRIADSVPVIADSF